MRGANPPWCAPAWAAGRHDVLVAEHQLSGTTLAYEPLPGSTLGPDGHWSLQPAGTAPYATRLLVVRPRDTQACNGTVLLEWLNVSAGHERGTARRRDLEAGRVWIGVSAQEVGLYGSPVGMGSRYASRTLPLLEHDPERYGALHHPGDQGAAELFRQAASVVPTVLDGVPVQQVLALGASQSAMRLVSYANTFGPGGLGVDGLLLSVWEGRAPRPSDGALVAGSMRCTLRDDLDVPVVVVNSEFEANAMAGPERLAPDLPLRRVWEVAGAPHATWSGPDPGAGRVGVNPLSIGPVHDAALAQLEAWVAGGAPAATHPPLLVDASSGRLARDDDGNTIGGIRLPELAVPTHRYRGMWVGSGRPPLFGGAVALPDEVIRARWPSAEVYLAAWDAAVDALVASRALLAADAPAARARGRDRVPAVLLDPPPAT